MKKRTVWLSVLGGCGILLCILLSLTGWLLLDRKMTVPRGETGGLLELPFALIQFRSQLRKAVPGQTKTIHLSSPCINTVFLQFLPLAEQELRKQEPMQDREPFLGCFIRDGRLFAGISFLALGSLRINAEAELQSGIRQGELYCRVISLRAGRIPLPPSIGQRVLDQLLERHYRRSPAESRIRACIRSLDLNDRGMVSVTYDPESCSRMIRGTFAEPFLLGEQK